MVNSLEVRRGRTTCDRPWDEQGPGHHL